MLSIQLRFSVFSIVTILMYLFFLDVRGVNADAIPSLDEVVANIRAGEKLFEDLDVDLIETIEMNPADQPFAEPIDIKHLKSKSKYVYQDGMFHKKSVERYHSMDLKDINRVETSYYDGLEMITNIDDRIININKDALIVPERKIKPHRILLHQNNNDQLSDRLSIESGSVERKNGKNITKYNIINKVIGFDVVDGMKCLKIAQNLWMEKLKKEQGFMSYYWLSIEKNYILVKYEVYVLFLSSTDPQREGSVLEWSEAVPGVWYPKNAQLLINDENLLRKNKKLLAQTCTFEMNIKSLHPNYDKRFFQMKSIPPGAVVYEFKNGDLIRSYKQKASFPWMIFFIGLVIVMPVGFYFARYYRIHRSQVKKHSGSARTRSDRSRSPNDSVETSTTG